MSDYEQRGLPDGWAWTRVGEVAKTTSGGTPSRKKPPYYNNGKIPWLKSGELNNSLINKVEEFITEEGLSNSSAKIFPRGTPLVALYGATVGQTGILGIDSATNQAICAVFALQEAFTSKYLIYWLQLHRQTLIDQSSGGAQPNINQGIVRAFPLPLAPLAEQRRIVAAIETLFTQLDAGVAALERVQCNLQRYKASVLKSACEGRLVPQDANDEPASTLLQRIKNERRFAWETEQLAKMEAKGKEPKNDKWKAKYKEPAGPDAAELAVLPAGWVWATMEQLSPHVTVGYVGKMKDQYQGSGIPFLRGQNVRENKFEPIGLKFVSGEFHQKLSKSALHPGDLVVVRSGSVGVTCVIPSTLSEANCSDLVIIKKSLGLVSEYGAYYMNSLAKHRIRRGQVGVALIHFNTKSVAKLPIPLPPLAEQRRIVAEVERHLSIITQAEIIIETNLKRAARLRQSILKRAFEGKLVGQDESDEPASELLARIRAETEKAEKKTAKKSRKVKAKKIRRKKA